MADQLFFSALDQVLKYKQFAEQMSLLALEQLDKMSADALQEHDDAILKLLNDASFSKIKIVVDATVRALAKLTPLALVRQAPSILQTIGSSDQAISSAAKLAASAVAPTGDAVQGLLLDCAAGVAECAAHTSHTVREVTLRACGDCSPCFTFADTCLHCSLHT